MTEDAAPPTAHAPPGAPKSALRGPWWALPLLLLATLAAFWPSLAGEPVYDDRELIQRNDRITSWSHVDEIFTEGYWDFLDPQRAAQLGYYRPLTRLAMTAAYAWGAGAPWAFHALAIAFHLGAVAGVFLLARRLFGSGVPAFFTALLFALHPLHVESVAWISALNDPLFGLFTALCLWFYLRWRDRGSRGIPIAAALCFALGLLSKELAFAALPAAVALDLGRRRRETDLAGGCLPLWRAYAPFLVVFAGYWALRAAVFGELGAGFSRVTTELFLGDSRMALLRVELLGGGLRLLTLPLELNLFRAIVPNLGWSDGPAVTALLWILGWVALVVWAAATRSRVILAGLAIIPAALLPMAIRIESLGMFPLSDRFLYLPVLGFALLLAGLAFRWLPRGVAAGALLLISGAYAWGTVERIGVWRNEEVLFRTSAAQNPELAYAQWGLGRVLLDLYIERDEVELLASSRRAFVRAQDLGQRLKDGDESLWAAGEDFLQSNLGVGWTLFHEAQIDGFEDFTAPEAVFRQILDRGVFREEVYTGLGACLVHQARFDEAEQAFKDALRINDRYVEAQYNLGKLHFLRGQWRLARHHLERAIELRPGRVRDHVELAETWLREGWSDKALEVARQAHLQFPDEPEPKRMLAALAAAEGDARGALDWLDRTLRLDPDDGQAHYLRGQVLQSMGQTAEAILSFRRACDLASGSFEAHYNLGVLLSQSGAPGAEAYLERAYRLGSQDDRLMQQLAQQLAQLRIDDAQFAFQMAGVDFERSPVRSRAWIDRALDLEPGAGPSLRLLARLQAMTGEPEPAAETFRRACLAMPEDFASHFELASLLETLGQGAEALHHYRRAQEIGPPPFRVGGEVLPDTNRIDRIQERIQALTQIQGPSLPPAESE